jgi:hypothetical protein
MLNFKLLIIGHCGNAEVEFGQPLQCNPRFIGLANSISIYIRENASLAHEIRRTGGWDLLCSGRPAARNARVNSAGISVCFGQLCNTPADEM